MTIKNGYKYSTHLNMMDRPMFCPDLKKHIIPEKHINAPGMDEVQLVHNRTTTDKKPNTLRTTDQPNIYILLNISHYECLAQFMRKVASPVTTA